jgi:hypothetical protein
MPTKTKVNTRSTGIPMPQCLPLDCLFRMVEVDRVSETEEYSYANLELWYPGSHLAVWPPVANKARISHLAGWPTYDCVCCLKGHQKCFKLHIGFTGWLERASTFNLVSSIKQKGSIYIVPVP